MHMPIINKVYIQDYPVLNFLILLYYRVQIKIGPAARQSNQWVYFGKGLPEIKSTLTEQHEKELTLFLQPTTQVSA